jgi:hypothetical protein
MPPLDHAHVNLHSGLLEPLNSPGGEEVERRVQELLKEFLGTYFNGVPFATALPGGGSESRTFAECHLLFDQATPPDGLAKPLIHTLLADRRDRDRERGREGYYAHASAFVWNILVRTHPQVPASGAGGDDSARRVSFRECRRVADQIRWLLLSPHAKDLSLKGILDIRVTNGPREIPSGAWYMRQLVVSGEVRWEERTYESPAG